jgi:hypothetical protein
MRSGGCCLPAIPAACTLTLMAEVQRVMLAQGAGRLTLLPLTVNTCPMHQVARCITAGGKQRLLFGADRLSEQTIALLPLLKSRLGLQRWAVAAWLVDKVLRDRIEQHAVPAPAQATGRKPGPVPVISSLWQAALGRSASAAALRA